MRRARRFGGILFLLVSCGIGLTACSHDNSVRESCETVRRCFALARLEPGGKALRAISQTGLRLRQGWVYFPDGRSSWTLRLELTDVSDEHPLELIAGPVPAGVVCVHSQLQTPSGRRVCYVVQVGQPTAGILDYWVGGFLYRLDAPVFSGRTGRNTTLGWLMNMTDRIGA